MIYCRNFFDCMTSQKQKQKRTLHLCKVLLGAANQIRTGDLVLTKDVLCLLSHSSIRKRQDELAFCGDPERARTVDL